MRGKIGQNGKGFSCEKILREKAYKGLNFAKRRKEREALERHLFIMEPARRGAIPTARQFQKRALVGKEARGKSATRKRANVILKREHVARLITSWWERENQQVKKAL